MYVKYSATRPPPVFSLQRRYRQSSRTACEKLYTAKVKNEQCRREHDTSKHSCPPEVGFGENRKPSDSDGEEGEDDCDDVEVAAMEVFEKGELGEFVNMVEAGLIDPFCCVEGHESAEIRRVGDGEEYGSNEGEDLWSNY